MSRAEGEGLPRIEGCERTEPPVEVSPYRGGEQTSRWLSNVPPQGPFVSDGGFEPGLTYPKAGTLTIIKGMTDLDVPQTAGDCCPETRLLLPRVAMSWVSALLYVAWGLEFRQECRVESCLSEHCPHISAHRERFS